MCCVAVSMLLRSERDVETARRMTNLTRWIFAAMFVGVLGGYAWPGVREFMAQFQSRCRRHGPTHWQACSHQVDNNHLLSMDF